MKPNVLDMAVPTPTSIEPFHTTCGITKKGFSQSLASVMLSFIPCFLHPFFFYYPFCLFLFRIIAFDFPSILPSLASSCRDLPSQSVYLIFFSSLAFYYSLPLYRARLFLSFSSCSSSFPFLQLITHNRLWRSYLPAQNASREESYSWKILPGNYSSALRCTSSLLSPCTSHSLLSLHFHISVAVVWTKQYSRPDLCCLMFHCRVQSYRFAPGTRPTFVRQLRRFQTKPEVVFREVSSVYYALWHSRGRICRRRCLLEKFKAYNDQLCSHIMKQGHTLC